LHVSTLQKIKTKALKGFAHGLYRCEISNAPNLNCIIRVLNANGLKTILHANSVLQFLSIGLFNITYCVK
jgi:hypothetical protein